MAINNAQQLEDAILSALESVRGDRTYVAQAQEVGNLAGKAINAAKAQMEYARLKKDLGEAAPKIRILEDGD